MSIKAEIQKISGVISHNMHHIFMYVYFLDVYFFAKSIHTKILFQFDKTVINF